MVSRRVIGIALFVVAGCGADPTDVSDMYPRNCGEVGPVDLLPVPADAGVAIERAGDHYLIAVVDLQGDAEYEVWAVDRCGEHRERLDSGAPPEEEPFGVAGDVILRCDPATGDMAVVDPAGASAPRPIFDAVEFCRVVPVGGGLAAQARGGGTVWFHPDPSDPDRSAVVVTDHALPADPSWPPLQLLRFDEDTRHPFGSTIQAAEDDLLVRLDDGTVLAYSVADDASRPVGPSDVRAVGVIEGDFASLGLSLGADVVVDLRTDEAFELCCYDDVWPIERFGDWLVKVWPWSPIIPAPESWTNLIARHVESGRRVKIEGADRYDVLAQIKGDVAVVDFSEGVDSDPVRRSLDLATGELGPLDLPGAVVWSRPERGAYSLEGPPDEIAGTLWFLHDPDGAPVRLAADVAVAFPTQSDRVVTGPARGRAGPLAVFGPDQARTEIDPGVVEVFGTPDWLDREPWPVDRDEVLYIVADGDGWMVRRTVLP